MIPVEAGGMGLFNIEEFLMAQQCCWVSVVLNLAGTTGATTYMN
jgi:hypothetical protein